MFGSKNKVEERTSDGMFNTTIISRDLHIDGNIVALNNIRLDGDMDGKIYCKSKVIIGESGVFKGEIFAKNIEIYGRVYGKIKVVGTTYLKKTSYVQGDMITINLITEEGAKFYGHCDMKEVSIPEVFDKIDKKNPKIEKIDNCSTEVEVDNVAKIDNGANISE